MSHWRKAHEPTWRINPFALWTLGASLLAAALVFITEHVHL
jgi:hypothetical protein